MRYLGLILAAGVLAADPAPPPAPTVVSALETPGGVVFAAPFPINWDSLLPANLRRAALAADPVRRRRLFERRTDYGTEASFSAPLPGRLAALHYYRARIEPAPAGGFVMIATDPLRLTMERSDFSVDSLLAERGADYPNRGTPFWRIVRQYQIRQVGGAGDRWVWVQWPADSAMVEGGCTVRMGLFRLGRVPTMVSSLDAGCDP